MSVETATVDSLTITPWRDQVIDALGHDPRSAYVETFWLGILGPTTTWLVRRLAHELDRSPEGFELPLQETARALGLGHPGGRHSAFMRAVTRVCQFGMAQPTAPTTLAVRRRLPPLNHHQLNRLPQALQLTHADWQDIDLRSPTVEQRRERARRLALSLVELGESFDTTERQLHRWHFHPAMARDATNWAWDHHQHGGAVAVDEDHGQADPVFPPRPLRSAPEMSGPDDPTAA